jgi:type III secretion system YscQ/HrcQ family protein
MNAMDEVGQRSSFVAISLGALPKISARAAAASRAIGRWLGSSDGVLTIRSSGIGSVRITFDGFETAELPSREELLLVGADGRRGRIGLDRSLALTMVLATIGHRRATRILRRLGRMERGVLAALVVPLIVRFNRRITVDLAPARLSASEPLVSLGATVEALGTQGRARLDVPIQWLSPFPVESMARHVLVDLARAFSVTASLVLASTAVAASDWTTAETGDAILFDGVPFPDLAAEWAVSLQIGEYSAAALLDRRGSISITEAFLATVRPAPVPGGASSYSYPKENLVMSANVDDQNRAVLAAAPVEVIAEVGRLTLRGDEILSLGQGSVLSFGGRDGLLTITAGGQPWARGELVEVDGHLGVRITELLRT